MELRVESIDFFERPTTTRLPFHFGAVTLRAATSLLVRLRASADGVACEGHSAELLVPRWFDKDPARTAADDERNLKESARLAARALVEAPPASVFELWRGTYQCRQREAPAFPGGGLAVGFGVALVERALIDAACRAAGASFFDALRADLFGYRAGALHAELEGWSPAESLAPAALDSIAVRHTIGMLDPLQRAELAADTRRDDGFPETLEEDVAAYGLRRFKIKLGGDPAADLPRLLRLAELLPELCARAEPGSEPWSITLDANEQYAGSEPLLALLDELARSRAGGGLLERLRFIEQPIPRAASFEPSLRAPLEALRRHAPCIIDEADADLDSFPRAIECGWRGVSVKACKGVFRALTNRGLCERRGAGLFQSGEDLTNLPVLPLQQDLCLAAALGLEDVERNGHHYFRGLDHLPAREARSAFEQHGDLYRALGDGHALRIEAGRLELRSLACVGLGYSAAIELPAEPAATVRGAHSLEAKDAR